MSKLPSLTSDKIIKILLEHGFVPDHQTGSHRVYLNGEQFLNIELSCPFTNY